MELISASPALRPGLRKCLPDEHMNLETTPSCVMGAELRRGGLEFSLEGKKIMRHCKWRGRQAKGRGGSQTPNSHTSGLAS